jgi:hypothetical protein
MLRIEGPDTLSIEEIEAGGWLRTGQRALPPPKASGTAGSLRAVRYYCKFPILVPETWNVLVNPQHAEAKLLEITMAYEHVFDARLL